MLEVKDVTIQVGEKPLMSDFSLIANDGKLTCITGQSGSGKTTFLRTLMGFLPVKKGFVSVDGELLTIYSAHVFRQLMTYLPQDIAALRHQLTPVEVESDAGDDYAVWGEIFPKVEPEVRPAALSSEEIFRLEENILSQSDKRIVIADEPAGPLPQELAAEIIRRLRQQADAGKTVVVASRHPMLLDLADQVITIENQNT